MLITMLITTKHLQFNCSSNIFKITHSELHELKSVVYVLATDPFTDQRVFIQILLIFGNCRLIAIDGKWMAHIEKAQFELFLWSVLFVEFFRLHKNRPLQNVLNVISTWLVIYSNRDLKAEIAEIRSGSLIFLPRLNYVPRSNCILIWISS